MTCLLPQIVSQAENTQLDLGPMPSYNQQNHRRSVASGDESSPTAGLITNAQST